MLIPLLLNPEIKEVHVKMTSSINRLLFAAVAALLVFASMTATASTGHMGYHATAGVHAAGPADTPPDPMAPAPAAALMTSTSTLGVSHATHTWRSPFRASATASALVPTAASPPLTASS